MTTLSPFERRLASYLDAMTPDRLGNGLVARVPADVDIVWSELPSPVGDLLLVARADGALVRVAFAVEGFDAVLEDVGDQVGRRTLNAPAPTDEVRRQLDEYFTGTRTTFDVPVDLALSSGAFRRSVQEHLADIPYGRTVSYADVAGAVGRPQAVRAVGTACARNPLPLVLPCHRVVRSDGSFGHYLGGTEAKSFLLEHEAAHRPGN